MDLRTVSFDVPKQEILTKDSVTVYVDAVVYYNIVTPLDSVCKVKIFMGSHPAMVTFDQKLGTSFVKTLFRDL